MLKIYISQLVKFSKQKAVISVILNITSNLTQGIGLLMIIPLLQILGLTGNENVKDGLYHFISNFFETMSLPFNLFTVLATYIVIISFFAIMKRYQTVLNVDIQHGFSVFLQNQLYNCLTYADWLFLVQRKTSNLTHALTSDIQRIGSGTMVFLLFLSSILLITVYIAVALIISPLLTGIALTFGLAMLGMTHQLNQKAYDTGMSFRASRQDLYTAVIEHLLVMKTAKSYGTEKQHIKHIEFINRKIKNELLCFSRVRATTQMYYEITAVFILAAFLVVAVKVIDVPVPRLILLVIIFARLMPKFSRLQQHYQHIKNMLPAFSGVMQLLYQARSNEEKNIKSPELTPPPQIKRAIRFKDVWFRYPGDRKKFALKNATFDIPARQITAITGPSGAGKSTLADLLLGLLKPDKGKIWVDDVEITGKHLMGWRHSIGYVPQETFLFHDTIRFNLLWANPTASEDDIWEALRMAAADEFVKKKAKGLDSVIGDRGLMLSGGERQRLALARALLRKPQLLLLDEATSSLDTPNETQIYRTIETLKDQMTIVIIAHRSSILRHAQHIIVLDKGELVETGPLKSIKLSVSDTDSDSSLTAIQHE